MAGERCRVSCILYLVCVDQEMVEGWLGKASLIQAERLARKDQRELRILKSYLQTFLDGYKWRESVPLLSVCLLFHVLAGVMWSWVDGGS